ncbi:MAG: NAD-dependent protein deacylase [Clostridia bacterium]|nr:NAD-dependent protein deacylase [Clostridia bacterium]
MDEISRFAELLDKCNNVVFFGGAGVSTESGIPDFRSVDGLYNMKYKYPPETILSHTFFMHKTDEFYDFYRNKMLFLDAEPNACHYVLARLEKESKLKAVVTQNIDGLHQKAGSSNVFELHGSVLRNHCMKCGRFYGVEKIVNSKGVPRCDDCDGIVKPDVVLYEEALDNDCIKGAVNAISKAEMLIIGGTSLTVYPASSLVYYFKGKHLVLINKSATSSDANADLVIRESIGKVFASIYH